MSTYEVTIGYKYSPDSNMTWSYTEEGIQANSERAAAFIAGTRFSSRKASATAYSDVTVTYIKARKTEGDA